MLADMAPLGSAGPSNEESGPVVRASLLSLRRTEETFENQVNHELLLPGVARPVAEALGHPELAL